MYIKILVVSVTALLAAVGAFTTSKGVLGLLGGNRVQEALSPSANKTNNDQPEVLGGREMGKSQGFGLISTTLVSSPTQTVAPAPTSSPSPKQTQTTTPTPTPTAAPTTTPGAPVPTSSLSPTPNSIQRLLEAASTPTPTPAVSTNTEALRADFKATGFRNTGVYSYTTQLFKGDTVSFDAGSSVGNIVSYEWDFGDGTRGTGKIVSHTYNTSIFNDFNTRLTVKDPNGRQNTTGGYYIHYIGEPRLIISVVPVPDTEGRKYACGQTISAKANAYSPFGEVTRLEWELMRGAISLSRTSDKVLQTKVSDKDGTIGQSFDCNTVLEDAVLQERDRNAVYSFVARKMVDSAGNELIYSNNNYFGGIGSVAVVVYVP